MKKLLSCAKTATVLLIASFLFLGFNVYMFVRPISYGMDYECKTTYAGGLRRMRNDNKRSSRACVRDLCR